MSDGRHQAPKPEREKWDGARISVVLTGVVWLSCLIGSALSPTFTRFATVACLIAVFVGVVMFIYVLRRRSERDSIIYLSLGLGFGGLLGLAAMYGGGE